MRKQARKLQSTLEVCNPKLRPLTDLLTGVKCRATSVAKNCFEYFAVGQKLGVVHICKRKSSNLKTFEALKTNKRDRTGISANLEGGEAAAKEVKPNSRCFVLPGSGIQISSQLISIQHNAMHCDD